MDSDSREAAHTLPTAATRSLTVSASLEPLRVDLFLTRQLAGCSRRRAQRAIAAGGVRINGRRARKGQQVTAGDVVQVPDALCAPHTLQPNSALQLPILYEDRVLIAIDKPPGIASHALRSDQTETVANFLLARYPELAGVGKTPFEAGAVHRLDTDTSGVLLVARTADAYRFLRQQFAQHLVSKEYLAVVHGDVRLPGEVRTPIAHHRNRRMMRVVAPSEHAARGRPALTLYRPLERLGRHTVLEVIIRTGVMHQIRVHLASIGHAVVGDRLYGPQRPNRAMARHLLHAHRVSVRHPETGALLRISSAMPADIRGMLDRWRSGRERSTPRHRETQGSRGEASDS